MVANQLAHTPQKEQKEHPMATEPVYTLHPDMITLRQAEAIVGIDDGTTITNHESAA